MLDNTKKKKRIYKCHNLSGNPEKDSRESAFAAEVLNNSTFKVMNFIFFCLFVCFLRKLVPVGYQKMAWHDLQEKNFPGDYFLSPPEHWGKKIEN